jgi:alginate O-acetyltransferase complex protein AlgI
MTFDSLTFALFFAIILALHNAPFSWGTRKANLLIASYLFYSAWNPPFVLLLLLSTVLDWFFARAMAVTEAPTRRKALLVATLTVNLGILGFFKYSSFLLANFVKAVALLGIVYRPPALDVVLPIGISFYTFHTLSYTIDVYRRHLKPASSFRDYALFVAFFPQLVAGPIMRARNFLPQLASPKKATLGDLGWGLILLTIGLFEKVVLADYIFSPVADSVFDAAVHPTTWDSWTGLLAFSGQIFCDFSGYSLCALGVALCLGFTIPENFHFPYAASGFSDFWRRWHISLSTWLRDYLYVGLGGNRNGRMRTSVNLMLTMVIGGLWHGASWSFVVWGGLHGLYLTIERFLRETFGRNNGAASPRFLQWSRMPGTFVVVTLTWTFFRSKDLKRGADLLESAFGLAARGVRLTGRGTQLQVLVPLAVIVFGQWYLRDTSLLNAIERLPNFVRIGIISAMAAGIVFASGDSRAFIYFQF